jgi:hypothetical protein
VDASRPGSAGLGPYQTGILRVRFRPERSGRAFIPSKDANSRASDPPTAAAADPPQRAKGWTRPPPLVVWESGEEVEL